MEERCVVIGFFQNLGARQRMAVLPGFSQDDQGCVLLTDFRIEGLSHAVVVHFFGIQIEDHDLGMVLPHQLQTFACSTCCNGSDTTVCQQGVQDFSAFVRFIHDDHARSETREIDCDQVHLLVR